MTERPAGLPSPDQVVALLDGEFARAGYEIEAVTIDGRSKPPRIRIVADGDTPLDLETVAELSRISSGLLDGLDTGATPYVLEVTSPGVDRPLTAERHFRRARGRKVRIELADATTVLGRLGAVDGGVADLVVPDRGGWTVRRIPLADIRTAVVQVEFSPPSAKELALVGGTAGTTETEAHA